MKVVIEPKSAVGADYESSIASDVIRRSSLEVHEIFCRLHWHHESDQLFVQ